MVINVWLVNKVSMSQAVDLKLTTLPQVQEPLQSPPHTLFLLSTVLLAVPESLTVSHATSQYVSHVNHPLNLSHQLSAKYQPIKSSQSSNLALMKSDARNVCNLHLMTVCNVLTLSWLSGMVNACHHVVMALYSTKKSVMMVTHCHMMGVHLIVWQ